MVERNAKTKEDQTKPKHLRFSKRRAIKTNLKKLQIFPPKNGIPKTVFSFPQP
jgi:hypothetical protein